MIRREARRIVTSPLAWFCVVIYAAVLLMGIAETLKIKEAISDQGWLDLLCVSEEYGITTLVKNLVFPMSVASVYFDEKKGKCDWGENDANQSLSLLCDKSNRCVCWQYFSIYDERVPIYCSWKHDTS